VGREGFLQSSWWRRGILQVRLASSNISVLQSILSYCVSGTFPCSLFNDTFSVTRDYIAGVAN
jgi:hypothetical protein